MNLCHPPVCVMILKVHLKPFKAPKKSKVWEFPGPKAGPENQVLSKVRL